MTTSEARRACTCDLHVKIAFMHMRDLHGDMTECRSSWRDDAAALLCCRMIMRLYTVKLTQYVAQVDEAGQVVVGLHQAVHRAPTRRLLLPPQVVLARAQRGTG